MASKNGHVELVDKLLEHGARVDLQTKVRTYIIVAEVLHIPVMHVTHLITYVHHKTCALDLQPSLVLNHMHNLILT